MKKIFSFLFFFSLLGIQWGHAQFDKPSAEVLEKVSKKYQTYRTVTADIRLTILNSGGTEEIHQGTLSMERASGKYLIRLAGREIINDGKTQWTVLTDQKEVQVTDADQDESQLSPASLFTFFQNGYSGDYMGNRQVGNKRLIGVSLTPLASNSNVKKIELYIEPESYKVEQAKVYDVNGGEYLYALQNLKVNTPLPYQTFLFNPKLYQGMEIVDLR